MLDVKRKFQSAVLAAGSLEEARGLRFGVVGLSHQSSPLALRERLAVPSSKSAEVLRGLLAHPALREAVILSTCNRVEYYFVSDQPEAAFAHVKEQFNRKARMPQQELAPLLYQRQDQEALRHLFRVTAGLDSMVLGETEITAQVKQAYADAHGCGATGPVINPVFQKALHSNKVLRARTGIAQGQASVGSVVTALAKDLFEEDFKNAQVLLWGAGKMAEAAANHLASQGVGKLCIVNRTCSRAQDLASEFKGMWLSWEHALGHLERVDIVIVCTQAPHYVLEEDDVQPLLARRGFSGRLAKRPFFIIDLSVPRNVDPALKRHPGIRLYDMDDLQSLVREGINRRRQALERCGALIEEQVQNLCERYTLMREVPC